MNASVLRGMFSDVCRDLIGHARDRHVLAGLVLDVEPRRPAKYRTRQARCRGLADVSSAPVLGEQPRILLTHSTSDISLRHRSTCSPNPVLTTTPCAASPPFTRAFNQVTQGAAAVPTFVQVFTPATCQFLRSCPGDG